MPAIVDEVVITVEVRSQDRRTQAPGGTTDTEERRDIVAECVEQVLEILEQQKER